VIFKVSGISVIDESSLDLSFGTEQLSTDTMTIEKILHISPETAPIIFNGSTNGGEIVIVRIIRDGMTDTLEGTIMLVGLKIFYNTTKISE
jgi:hypothetical protein